MVERDWARLRPYDLAHAPDALTTLPTTHTQGKLAIHIP